MSIWNSVFPEEVDGRDCYASSFDHPGCDQYKGAGADEVHVGVATAHGYHGATRLDLDSYPAQGVDVQVLLSGQAAETLRDMLNVALARLAATRAGSAG